MKRNVSIMLMVVFMIGLFNNHVVAQNEATPTASLVYVNGNTVSFDAYFIDGNNYFKLRDVAYMLNNTEKQFAVGYDGAANAISLISAQMYTPVGGEMIAGNSGAKPYIPTSSKIIKDGVEIQLTAYLIDGNNYFKLRDIGEAFNFGVDWDGAKNAIMIDTKKNYTSEVAATSKVPQGFTDGYEFAEFSKFNSPASENGLGGTNIYLDCVLDKITLMYAAEVGNFIAGYLTDSTNNKWMVLLHADMFVNPSEFESIIGKPIVLCGMYDGFSGTEQMPVLYMTELCVKETGEVKPGIQKMLSLAGIGTNVSGSGTNATTPSQSTTDEPTYNLSSESGITSYLSERYSSVDTVMGKWKFTFSVLENEYESSPDDYTIWVKYDLGQMNDLQYSNKFSESQKEEIKKQLKQFMKTIADDLLDKIDGKKIQCSYHYSYYKYEYIREGLRVMKYCTWTNYEPGGNYSDTPVSTFRWYPDYDEEVW